MLFLKKIYYFLKKYFFYFRHRQKLNLSISDYFLLTKKDHNYRQEMKVKLNGDPFLLNSPFWFVHGLDEIMVNETYRFNSKTSTPQIIDCGANIGLSVIYFKTIYPNANIIAFEADANIFKLLSQNLEAKKYQNITLHNKAVWVENTVIRFEQEGTVGGKISNDAGLQTNNTYQVEAQRLKDLLSTKIDFLKIDIEGAEYDVLLDCADELKNVENLFVEYHSFTNTNQQLHLLLSLLNNAGFRYYIKEAWNNQPNPFVNTATGAFDLQLNIFCYRQ